MSNSSSQTDTHLFVTYYPFFLIIAGTVFNFFTFFILVRPVFRDTSKRPPFHYMRTMAIFDILMLYGWNLDHYLYYGHGFTLQGYTVVSCKIVTFLDYFVPQVSAWLRVFVCLDRYASLSHLQKTWLNKSKNVLIIIACIITVFTLINLHLLIFACFYNTDGTVNPSARLYEVYPLWDDVNLALYNCIPFILMAVFNSGVVYHLIRLRKSSTVQNSKINHRSISITLVITTCLFLIMTTPATITYGFFPNTPFQVIPKILDYVLYTYHILSFLLYFTTFTEFRQEVIRLVSCSKWRNTQPTTAVTKVTGA